MSRYFNPPELVKEKGEKVFMIGNEMPIFNNTLVAFMDRLAFKLAVDVSDPAEFEYYYSQYSRGYSIVFDLYDVDPKELEAE